MMDWIEGTTTCKPRTFWHLVDEDGQAQGAAVIEVSPNRWLAVVKGRERLFQRLDKAREWCIE